MTLKTRNTFLKTFFLSSLLITFVLLVIFIVSFLTGSILTPPDLRIPAFLNKFIIFKNSFIALFISFGILFLYVPFCFYLLLRFFENTQTTEIIFFSGFLFSCLAEGARFISICLGLWQSFSNTLIFAGNIVLFGRTLAPLSFLCAALLSETTQRQDIERNYIIMIASSLVFAAVIPMNTARIASTGLVTEGFMPLINMFRFLLFASAIISFYIHGIKKNSTEHKYMSLSSGMILIGYSLLVTCDNFVFLVLGSAGLCYGTYLYLLYIHKLYMWG